MKAPKRPKFDPKDPWWVSLEDLATLIGVKRAMLDRHRSRLGNVYEHKTGRGRAAPVFIYAKLWLPLWSELRRRRSTQSNRLQRVQTKIAELQYRKLLGELVDANEFISRFLNPWCDRVRRGVDRLDFISRPAYDHMNEIINEANEEILRAHPTVPQNGNGHTTNGFARRQSRVRGVAGKARVGSAPKVEGKNGPPTRKS